MLKKAQTRNRKSDRLSGQMNMADEITPPPLEETKGWNIVDTVSAIVREEISFDEKEIKRKLDTNLKPYLSSEELRNFTWLFLTAGYADMYRASAAMHGNLSKEEHKYLATASTNMKKFVATMLNRFDEKEERKIIKRASGATIKVFDRPTLNKLMRASDDVLKEVLLDRGEFEDFCELIIHQTCRNCKMDGNACHIRELFEDAMVPDTGWHMKNCPYAYEDGDAGDVLGEVVKNLQGMRGEKRKILEKDPMNHAAMDEVAALDKAIELTLRKRDEK